nr:hypothetical protein [Tanacetum cinerariifolium]
MKRGSMQGTSDQKHKFDDRRNSINNKNYPNNRVNNYQNNHNNNSNRNNDYRHQQNRRPKTFRTYAATLTESNGNKEPATRSNLKPVSVTCHACGEKGHCNYQCSKTNNSAHGRAYLLRNKNAHRDPNVITGTFLLNHHLARVLFDSGADKSFVSISLASMLNIPPITLDTTYDIEMANGNLEKLLKQITKIEWLRKGDHNTAYFYKVLKGRVSKSRNEVFTDDTGNTFYGDDIPTKFVEHFKLVLDKEIKAAMFAIKDDKAAGPDGFTLKKLLGELNTNLISLIPKLKIPMKLSDYRPIACCNVVYKCISKVLTNRLKEGLNGIVDYNQCVFIPGRHISDNILLTQDLMVRQGDPISPYLFTLMMEVLNLMIKRQICNDKRFKFHPGCKAFGLTHLCFVDDLLLLCHGDLISTCVLRRGLDVFSMCPGLYPSTLPISYLGVPMMTRKLCNDDCRVLIDNVKKKIFDWKTSIFRRLHICAIIDKILKYFLWSFEESRKGFTSVSCKDIRVPKSQGGLDLRSMELMNEAWCWRRILKLMDKIMAKHDNVSNVWAEVVSGQERNFCLYGNKSRTVDLVFNLIINTIRLKLLSLDFKFSRDVGIAAMVWHLPNLGLKGSYRFVFVWWIEEFQEVVLPDGLDCCIDCIDSHKVMVLFGYGIGSLVLCSLAYFMDLICGDVSIYTGWS